MRTLALVLLLPALAGAQEPVKLGGQFRVRYELMDRQDYGAAAPAKDLDMLVLRTRVWADGRPADGVKVFAELQDARTAGTEASVSANSANVDLRQGFLEVSRLGGSPLSVKAGRFAMSYGDQRLVSELDWSNIGRAWDGLRLRWEGETAWLDAFATVLNEFSGAKRDFEFGGLYASCKAVAGHEFDAYLLTRSGRPATGATEDFTAGVRAKGVRGGLDYSAEAARQFGRRSGKDVAALGAAVTAGWTFDAPWKPRVGGEYDYASGDKSPTDGENGTFDPLFPFQHSYQGFADVVGWRNIHAASARLSAKPAPAVSLHADVHLFRLAQKKDAWYTAAGTATAQDATGVSGSDIGRELDLHVRASFRQAVKLWGGYSRFFAGDFAKASAGGKKDKDWLFLQAAVEF